MDADYNQVQLCNSYSTCRTWAQQTLGDMQSFQSDRRTLAVPSQFSSIDSQYGDGLSAGIAALNELINGMDTDNVSKIRDGFKKLEGAMLTIAKAETALGPKFDIRNFHDTVLQLGSVPLPVLAARIDRFIAEGGPSPYPQDGRPAKR